MKSRASGYTLVELLSVLAILGLISMLVWPRYQAVADVLALRQDAAIMARELRLTRQSAVTYGRECAVAFKHSSTSYEVRQGQKPRTIELRRGVETVWTRFPQDPVNLGKWSACRFLPLGNPVQGGTVHLRNRRNQSLYVVVTPITGRVRISETDPGN
ncbi:MAG: GspH/FimT family pseudopilin [Syntrophomonadales bacterium]|jgi:prepilin-type N-terminal cleavage/methylation domain-containing protein